MAVRAAHLALYIRHPPSTTSFPASQNNTQFPVSSEPMVTATEMSGTTDLVISVTIVWIGVISLMLGNT